MDKQELIQKISVYSKLCDELDQEGIIGILRSIDGIKVQCDRKSFIKIASNKPINICERGCSEYPYEAYTEFKGFTAFVIGSKEEIEVLRILAEGQEITDEDNQQSESAVEKEVGA
jgi:hypothetical protein